MNIKRLKLYRCFSPPVETEQQQRTALAIHFVTYVPTEKEVLQYNDAIVASFINVGKEVKKIHVGLNDCNLGVYRSSNVILSGDRVAQNEVSLVATALRPTFGIW